jgi:hypothetical protein
VQGNQIDIIGYILYIEIPQDYIAKIPRFSRILIRKCFLINLSHEVLKKKSNKKKKKEKGAPALLFI